MSPTEKTQTLVEIDGQVYDAVREFGPDANGVERVIVKYVGLYTFAYRMPGMREWHLEDANAPPAPPEQEAALAALVRESGTLDTTTVDVESPEGG